MTDADHYKTGYEDGEQDRKECYDSWLEWGKNTPKLPEKYRPDYWYKRGYTDGVNGLRYHAPRSKQ